MHYYEIAPLKIIRSDKSFFTYQCNSFLEIGKIVLVPISKSSTRGIVLREVEQPIYSTKDVTSVLYEKPIPKELINLCIFISTYYKTPLGIVIGKIIPKSFSTTRKVKNQPTVHIAEKKIVLNDDQNKAVEIISKSQKTVILNGITGSGKTQVYIESIKKVIEQNKSAIVLIPEISLTSQMIGMFENYFGQSIIVTNSQQTEAQRRKAWIAAITTESPKVIVGPRSALFLPLDNIGIIIIDEFHDGAYKQDQSPKYSAIRAAAYLARQYQASLVLGSATPTVSEYYIAKNIHGPIIKMNKKAIQLAKPSSVFLVDSTDHNNFSRHRFLSNKLIDEMNNNLLQKKQTLIFHNRRGSSQMTICENCGWTALCQKCFLPMVLHVDKNRLICHSCGQTLPIPFFCPKCKNPDIIHKGIGTKLIESEVKKMFPFASVRRFDTDNKSEDSVNNQYESIYNGSVDILVGTQIIAKGLDLPNLKTVGIIQADNGLSLPDFASSERVFQLICQVVGRVGRNNMETSVVVQTYQKDHPAIRYGIEQDFNGFYKSTIEEREKSNFPPFCYLLKLTCTYKSEGHVIERTREFSSQLHSRKGITVLGPAPSFHERFGDYFRWQIIVKSRDRNKLLEAIDLIPDSIHWKYDIDPISLL
jgi:primosomal protein N' (replication factor Y)